MHPLTRALALSAAVVAGAFTGAAPAGATAGARVIYVDTGAGVMCVDGADPDRVQQWYCNDGAHQQWFVNVRADYTVEIRSAVTGRCLDSGQDDGPGRPARTGICDGGRSQAFRIGALDDGGTGTLDLTSDTTVLSLRAGGADNGLALHAAPGGGGLFRFGPPT
jgi:hypothetical protein